ncbi:hypothetical protein GUITHDRAFT_104373 [Guillardia theta CCMP2712]|uniref:Uncharacterized protein n=1 Tax=Guillardia theta (strain CCMP2712) TaxID=905079 RepID=L1JPI6_GUITC|nr:hypothetical protein GUITHDRAFT_104373 [Guillardia theta CCMP2712]EKX49978.1 hypothetical protein GUITHDRAFT_104373 [Guillardia theta CCMP2712]|eukprot:XP_005836958.1 hypothetical protein GUITHDRAFT_104373 [Guillardia theta CCMP2712]
MKRSVHGTWLPLGLRNLLLLAAVCCTDSFILNSPKPCYTRNPGRSAWTCSLGGRERPMQTALYHFIRQGAPTRTTCLLKTNHVDESGYGDGVPLQKKVVLKLVLLWKWMAQRIKLLVLSFLTIFLSLSIQLNAAQAASICIPVPTFNGIGHVCIESGPNKPEKQTPEYVNPQQTPANGEGNILSRAGFRPQTMFQESWARIQASARWKLIMMEEADALYQSSQQMDERSQIVAGMIDPVVTGSFVFFGDDAVRLIQTCQTIARKAAEEIFPIDFDENGVIEKESLPENQVLAAAVRYSSMVFLNATRQDVVVHRVVADEFKASEVEKAFEAWENTLMEEEFRGVPVDEYPHKPGEFQVGSWDEKPKPAITGIALEKRAEAIELVEDGAGDWKEILWMNPRRKAPVEYAMIPPSTRSIEEQEFIEDRRAANQDRVHKILFNKTGGYLKRLQEVRKRRELPLATAEEWKEANKTGGMMDDDDDRFIDIRKADFNKLYTEEYGDDWKKDFPEDFKAVKEENLRLIQELKEWYHKERGRNFNTPADVLKLSGLQLQNVSSGINLGKDFDWNVVNSADDMVKILRENADEETAGEAMTNDLKNSTVQRKQDAGMAQDSNRIPVEVEWVLDGIDESIRKELEELECTSMFATELYRIMQEAKNVLIAMSNPESLLIDGLQFAAPDEKAPSIGQIISSLSESDKVSTGNFPSMIMEPESQNFTWQTSNDSSLLALANASKTLEEYEAEVAAQQSSENFSLPVDMTLKDVVRDVGNELIQSCVLNFRWRSNDREKSEKLEEALKRTVQSKSFSRIVSKGVLGRDEVVEMGEEVPQNDSNKEERHRRADSLISLIGESEELEKQLDDYVIFDLNALGINISQGETSNLTLSNQTLQQVTACKLMLPRWQWTVLKRNKELQERISLRFFDKLCVYMTDLQDNNKDPAETLSNDMQAMLDEVMDKLEEFVEPDQDSAEQVQTELVIEEAQSLQSSKEQEEKERKFAIANRAAFGFPEPHCVATLMVNLCLPKSDSAKKLIASARTAMEAESLPAFAALMENLTYSGCVPKNLVGFELLWTTEAQRGFEIEDARMREAKQKELEEKQRQAEQRKEEERKYQSRLELEKMQARDLLMPPE